MDPSQATKVVYSRINKLETEDVAKEIISYILLQDQYDREMIRLAFGPDNLIHGTIGRVKSELGLVSKPTSSPSMNLVTIPNLRPQFSPCLPVLSPPFPSPKTVRVPTTYCEPPLTYSNSIEEDYRYQLEQVNQGQSDFDHDYYYPEEALGNLTLSRPEFPVKVCHYYNKGFCKHGTNCRYFHGQSFQDSYPQIFSPNSNDVANDDQVLLLGSLERLELEITEILKSRRGSPVSIASLPMMYYERFGKTLQAEGYLTESQRHGKTGYSLTKLLARLKNSIRLIDRPHGQHAVILMEDAPKFMENRFERNDPGLIVSGSRQIYLTFPAESSFTEEDVSNYFNSFGPVQDVRIPFQQKRMFGFVTFVCAESVKMTLSNGNPHYVCGARVLVKPYREKSKLVGRKYAEKLEPSVYNHCHEEDMDSELQARWESSRLLRKQLIEEHKHALEIERRRLSQLQLARKGIAPVKQTNFGYSMGELKVLYHSKFSAASPFNCQSDVFHSSSTNDHISKHEGANCTNQENSQGLELPDNPFASPLSSSISTVK